MSNKLKLTIFVKRLVFCFKTPTAYVKTLELFSVNLHESV